MALSEAEGDRKRAEYSVKSVGEGGHLLVNP